MTIIVNSEPFSCDRVVLEVSEIYCEKEKGNNKYMVYYYYERIYWYKITLHFSDM